MPSCLAPNDLEKSKDLDLQPLQTGVASMKDKMRRFWFLTIHHFPNGEKIGNVKDEQDFDIAPILDAIDVAFTGNLRFRRATLECGDKKGAFHVHAYVETWRSVRWSTVCRRTEDMYAKVKVVEHSKHQVAEYCNKQDDATWIAGPYDLGQMSSQRKDESLKSPLDEVIDLLQIGTPIREVARSYPKTWVLYGKRLKDWLNDLNQPLQMVDNRIHQ